MERYEIRRRRRRAHWRIVRGGPGGAIERRVRIKATWVKVKVRLDPNPQLPFGFPEGGEKDQGEET